MGSATSTSPALREATVFADWIVTATAVVVAVVLTTMIVLPLLVWLGAVVDAVRKPDNNKLGPM